MNTFDWHAIFINDFNLQYALEILLRTFLMFTLVIVMLRMSGKKGVRQLSLFEVAIIIALGSAAGDPMFNKDIAILPSLLVFTIIIIIYRTLTYFASKSEKVEEILEGEAMYIIEDGIFVLQSRAGHNFAKDEFFAEMRLENIEHVGQVKTAILETNGKVSFFFYEDDEVKYGLPILPKTYGQKSEKIQKQSTYACTYCGLTEELSTASTCSRCQHQEWVEAIKTVRVT